MASDPPAKRKVGRKLLKRLLLAVTVPAVFLLAAELLLRVAGYGYSPSFFVKTGEQGIVRTNEKFCWTFDPPHLARGPLLFPVTRTKPPDTFRVFVMGASAARGTPLAAYGFSRILEVMLRDEFPNVNFEILNTGITAINSHVVREITKDCRDLDADLFIIYLGNNEVVGPYGPGALSSRFSSHLWFIRASIWAKSLRLGQLMGNAKARISRRDLSSSHWKGMEMFARHEVHLKDDRLANIYSHFRQNLRDICNIAQEESASVLLCTVPVNLNDCPPFKSNHRIGISPDDLTTWQRHFDAGVAMQTQANDRQALEQYHAAMKIDGQYAELVFRMGQCNLAMNTDAVNLFRTARDLDTLRFRADTGINMTIRNVSSELNSDSVRLVDTEGIFQQHTLRSLPGSELFLEHVHPTFKGNYLFAQSVFPETCQLVSQRLQGSEWQHSQPLVIDRCRAMLAFTPHDERRELQEIAGMTGRPPFTNQPGHEDRFKELTGRITALSQYLTPEALQAAADTYERAINASPSDSMLHHNFALLLLATGRFADAIQHLEKARAREPNSFEIFNNLGVALSSLGRFDDALEAYKRAAAISPYAPDTYCNMGVIHAGRGSYAKAIGLYEEALTMNPDYAPAYNNLGSAYKGKGDVDKAIESCLKAAQIDPDHANARRNLGVLYAMKKKWPEATTELRHAIRLTPHNAELQERLGIAYSEQGMRQEALTAFLSGLEINPEGSTLFYRTAVEYYNTKQLKLARKYYDRAKVRGVTDDKFEQLLPE